MQRTEQPSRVAVLLWAIRYQFTREPPPWEGIARPAPVPVDLVELNRELTFLEEQVQLIKRRKSIADGSGHAVS